MTQSTVEVKIEKQDSVTIISILSPRIPADLSDSFEDHVVRTIHRLTEPKVLLDFAAVRFISSSILGKLIKLNGRIVTDQRGQFKLCSLDDSIAEVFRITGLHTLFSIHPTREKALASFT